MGKNKKIQLILFLVFIVLFAVFGPGYTFACNGGGGGGGGGDGAAAAVPSIAASVNLITPPSRVNLSQATDVAPGAASAVGSITSYLSNAEVAGLNIGGLTIDQDKIDKQMEEETIDKNINTFINFLDDNPIVDDKTKSTPAPAKSKSKAKAKAKAKSSPNKIDLQHIASMTMKMRIEHPEYTSKECVYFALIELELIARH